MIDLETAEEIVFDGRADGPSAVAAPMTRDVLDVGGPDAAAYLQGQISQDAEGLTVGSTAWTLLLQPQGKVQAWLRLHRLADDRFLLDGDTGSGPEAVSRLERFKLRVDVSITLRSATVLAVRGPGAQEVTVSDGNLVLDATWGGVDGVDVMALPVDEASGSALADGDDQGDAWMTSLLAELTADGSVAVAPTDVLDVVRVVQGLPTAGRELDESTIPAAARIVDRSVDFTKGCYVGQELVARIDSRGSNTPTRLVGLRFADDSVPEAGAELELDGAAAGTVTSVVRSATRGPIGLGYVRRAVEVPGSVQLAASAAETVELPAP